MDKRKRGWIIAIDGPSGAGKSTIAKRLARRLNYLYIDTGAMYRAIGLKALRANPKLDDQAQIVSIACNSQIELKDTPEGCGVFLDGEEVTQTIRAERVSQAASIVSGIPEVRRVLVQAQQQMGANGAVVLEGRDIGTKVFPDAELKIFLDASERTRAQRRYEENLRKGVMLTLEETVAEINERDGRDSQRADSPLVQADDAVYLDTSGKTIDEVLQEILRLVEKLEKDEVRSADEM
ncbi:MAG: (d)CMP kinase [Acidobacteria bacterium]|nr:(d)CMP kinase [Acidobacteriota bacterium]MCI0721296.1 (d)CMP kinase [Acidobacteriota bacterium]